MGGSLFKRSLKATSMWAVVSAGLFALSYGSGPAYAGAGIFEIIHPDVEKGQIEFEALNSFSLDAVEDGEERSVHEFAVGYSVTDFLKVFGAVEVANPEGGSAEVEAFEFGGLILLLGGHGHDNNEKPAETHEHQDLTIGLFAALEVPREGGIDEGALEIGPVVEAEFGPLQFVGNLFVEIPFANGEDPGLAYQTQLVLPINDHLGIGVENYGEFEGLFGERGDDVHFVGPGLYWNATLANGHVVEPRVAVLFGLTDDAPDAILSANLEYKIPPH